MITPLSRNVLCQVYADFVGAQHNVRFDLQTGMGVSTRCSDSNVVLVRSIKSAKEQAK